MRLVVFGLTVSSSWGNGHATLWRGLIRALHRQGCQVTFFERNTPYYATNRDLEAAPWLDLVLYDAWEDVLPEARRAVREADVAMVTSYCPDGIAATELVLQEARGLRSFYDLDTPVTLSRIARGESTDYIGPDGLAGFDLVLSYTGGAALNALRTRLGARRVLPLYGHVDPEFHQPTRPTEHYSADLSYLGTYSVDRQRMLEKLFVEPARRRPENRFVIAGAQYPQDFPWAENIYFVRHLPPPEHPAFFSSSRFTLNVTRSAMAAMGWCPSGRLFEAAACGTTILTDAWEGLDTFFTPQREMIVVRTTADVLDALQRDPEASALIGEAARERVLSEHTAAHRASTLLDAFSTVRDPPQRLEA